MVVDDELIAKYLAGEADPDEAKALFDWMTEPENVAHFEKMQATWDSTFPSRTFKPKGHAKAWNRVSQQIATEKVINNHKPKAKSRALVLWYGVAASIIIALGFFKFFGSTPVKSEETLILSAKDTPAVTLPDSSGVVLNRNSTLSYGERFGTEAREVNLKGEAYFKVKKNVEKPFIIHAGIANIRVVGTVFNVHQDDDAVQISVEEGKVLVYNSNDSIYLEAGQMATVRMEGKAIAVADKVDINNWGYATRRFVFKDAPLSEVFASIENAYPFSIEIRNKDIKNCKLTASFDRVSAQEILNLIGETLDLTIQQNESTFRVEGKGCPWVQ